MSKNLRVPVYLGNGGILHDTSYHRGAESREEAARINDSITGEAKRKGWGTVDYVWEEYPDFEAALKVKRAVLGRNRVTHFELVEDHGRRFPMFPLDLADMLTTVNISDGWIEKQTYTVIKKGTAYGIRAVK